MSGIVPLLTAVARCVKSSCLLRLLASFRSFLLLVARVAAHVDVSGRGLSLVAQLSANIRLSSVSFRQYHTFASTCISLACSLLFSLSSFSLIVLFHHSLSLLSFNMLFHHSFHPSLSSFAFLRMFPQLPLPARYQSQEGAQTEYSNRETPGHHVRHVHLYEFPQSRLSGAQAAGCHSNRLVAPEPCIITKNSLLITLRHLCLFVGVFFSIVTLAMVLAGHALQQAAGSARLTLENSHIARTHPHAFIHQAYVIKCLGKSINDSLYTSSRSNQGINQ